MIEVYKETIGKPLEEQLTSSNNKPYPVPDGATVSFKMRSAFSDEEKVSGLGTVVNAAKGLVKYDWHAEDLDTAGEFQGWWSIATSAGPVVEFDEFQIFVLQHAPGRRTHTGPIYRQAKAMLPSTWVALEDSNSYGDSLLQEKIEVVKLSVLGVSLPVEDESVLDIRVINFIAKSAALQIIPAGIDYWLDQKVSVTIETGGATQESVTYEKRVDALKELYKILLKEIANEEDIIDEIIGTEKLRGQNSVPAYTDGIDAGFVTPAPNRHFRDYAFPQRRGFWNPFV